MLFFYQLLSDLERVPNLASERNLAITIRIRLRQHQSLENCGVYSIPFFGDPFGRTLVLSGISARRREERFTDGCEYP